MDNLQAILTAYHRSQQQSIDLDTFLILTLLNCVFSGEQVQDSDKLEDIQL
jgi:hypothetical protein